MGSILLLTHKLRHGAASSRCLDKDSAPHSFEAIADVTDSHLRSSLKVAVGKNLRRRLRPDTKGGIFGGRHRLAYASVGQIDYNLMTVEILAFVIQRVSDAVIRRSEAANDGVEATMEENASSRVVSAFPKS